ncbi:hypothetical protein MMC18_008805 [Xylographa bjoerkii]|nr:hypothetical protein [Xylographa bjoerkii]
MDPYLEELARLAHNAALDAAPPIDEDPPSSQVARYQRLFHYSAPEALTLIRQQRSDPTRLRVPDTLWTLVQSSASAAGYDREAYEHCLRVGRQPFHQAPPTRRPSVPLTTATEEAATYLLKLDGPLARPSDVQAAANLPAPPPVLDGKGENGSASFCLVGALARQAIDAWLAARHSPFRPTFIRYSIARKALSPTSASPTLGIDATLPQHRPGSACAPCLPAQNQYPVWYFLYGTLADPSVLAAQLDLPEDKAPVLREARVRGGGGC